jgi:hypothetical protein
VQQHHGRLRGFNLLAGGVYRLVVVEGHKGWTEDE